MRQDQTSRPAPSTATDRFHHPDGFAVDVIEEDDGVVVVALGGEIDVVAVDELRQAVRKAASRSRRLVIDMTEMTFIDSSGLGVIARAHREFGQLREAIVLRSPNAAARRVLAISGIDRLVTIDDATIDGAGKLRGWDPNPEPSG
jgi:anti-sigma B factor antagonist